jgi:hypothetical protein
MIKNSGKIWDLMWKLNLILIYYHNNIKKVFASIGLEFGNIKNLDKKYEIVQKEININVTRFEKEKVNIKDGYFFELNSKFAINSIVSNILSVKYPNNSIISGKIDNDRFHLSARRQDGKFGMNALLSKLVSGLGGANFGGHEKAAGASFFVNQKVKFLKRLKGLSIFNKDMIYSFSAISYTSLRHPITLGSAFKK